MVWFKFHAELVNNFCKNGIIKSEKVYQDMLATDGACSATYNPYMDPPQSIEYQATITDPHIHTHVLWNSSTIMFSGFEKSH
uniref:protein-L-isoaspartate(D-aspartate) O-methyltransferase n=1 Tax=Erpetoichthys calabaricus TaxID=27687 RepID=A0A8C4X6C5_ERPCA